MSSVLSHKHKICKLLWFGLTILDCFVFTAATNSPRSKSNTVTFKIRSALKVFNIPEKFPGRRGIPLRSNSSSSKNFAELVISVAVNDVVFTAEQRRNF